MLQAQVSPASNFDAKSPWQVGPLLTRGHCIDGDDPWMTRYVWVNFRAPIYSGCKVTLLLETQHSGLVLAGKILEFTRDGAPWLVCFGDKAHTRVVAVPLEHPKLRVLAIGADVGEMSVPKAAPSEPIPDDDIWRGLEPIGRRALAEWRTKGFPRPQTLRAINRADRVELVRRFTCHH